MDLQRDDLTHPAVIALLREHLQWMHRTSPPESVHALDVDASGRTLAMGSTTGGLWVSADAGEHWQELSRDLPLLSTVRFA